jgi:hypothetical protein
MLVAVVLRLTCSYLLVKEFLGALRLVRTATALSGRPFGTAVSLRSARRSYTG